MTTISDFPGTPALYLNADNVDGLDNELIAHGGDVSAWKTEGSAGLADFTAVGADEPTKLRANPYMKKSATEQSVAFDGVFNQLTSVGSAGLLNFIHTTGVFDLFLVHRRRAGGNERRLFGCSGGSGQKGIQVLQQMGAVGTDGNLQVVIGNNAGLLVTATSTLRADLGKPTLILIRGDGTRLRITKNFYYWQNTTFTGSLATGNANGDYCLGSIATSQATPNLFEGDHFIVCAYDTNLSLSNLVAWKAAAEAQLGVEL